MKFDHNNISPLDNRYLSKISDIRNIFSEHVLIKTRFIIEINWLLFLCALTSFDKASVKLEQE